MSNDELKYFKSLARDFCVPSPVVEKIIATCHTYEAARRRMLSIVFDSPDLESSRSNRREMSGVRFSVFV